MEPDVGMLYVRTIPGVLKILESILAFVCFICAMIYSSSWSWSLLAFLKTASLMSFSYCIAILLFRIFRCTNQCPAIPWNKLDCICSLFLAILLLVSSLMFCQYIKTSSLQTAIIFAYASSTFFVLDTFYKILYLLR